LACLWRQVSDDYFVITSMIKGLADEHCGGKVVAIMEGGYCCHAPPPPAKPIPRRVVSTETIKECVEATCRALAGVQ
jgi:hypothetical protein